MTAGSSEKEYKRSPMEAAAVREGGCGAEAVSARHACSSRDYDPVFTSRSCYRTRAVAQRRQLTEGTVSSHSVCAAPVRVVSIPRPRVSVAELDHGTCRCKQARCANAPRGTRTSLNNCVTSAATVLQGQGHRTCLLIMLQRLSQYVIWKAM